MDLFQAVLGGPIGQKSIAYGDAESLWRDLFQWSPTKSKQSVNWQTALKVSTVLACCRVLAEGVAQVPFRLIRTENGTRYQAVENSLYKILGEQPNDFQTSFEFRETMMYHAILTGNGVAQVTRNGRGEIMEILPIPPESRELKQNADWSIVCRVTMPDGQVVTLEERDLFIVRGPSWAGGVGLDIVKLAREAIGLAMATEESHALLHGNGVQPGGILYAKMTDTARAKMREHLKQSASGQGKFGTLLLDTEFKYQQLSMNGVDAEHLPTRKFQIEEVCRSIKCSPFMVYQDEGTATHAASEQFLRRHVTHDLSPWYGRWEGAVKRQLISRANLSVKFYDQALMRGDPETRAQFYASGIQWGWLTRNEVRILEDMDPLPGLDEPLSPLNMGSGSGVASSEEAVKSLARNLWSIIKADNSAFLTAR